MALLFIHPEVVVTAVEAAKPSSTLGKLLYLTILDSGLGY
jgi:hypothetical protein